MTRCFSGSSTIRFRILDGTQNVSTAWRVSARVPSSLLSAYVRSSTTSEFDEKDWTRASTPSRPYSIYTTFLPHENSPGLSPIMVITPGDSYHTYDVQKAIIMQSAVVDVEIGHRKTYRLPSVNDFFCQTSWGIGISGDFSQTSVRKTGPTSGWKPAVWRIGLERNL